jgi:glucose-fructose oxidoreductase
MTAYRLHFDPLARDVIDLVRSGRLGEPRLFTSTFSFHVRPENVRTLSLFMGGGSLYDIGVYCINTARNLFEGEPTEVAAFSVSGGATHPSDFDESAAGILRFGRERLASFVTSFDASSVTSYRIVGTEGDLRVEPGYDYTRRLAYHLTVDGKTEHREVDHHDQFAAQLRYFSDCVLNEREPEPSGVQGLRDVRVVEALLESARTGRAVQIPAMPAPFKPDPR